MRKKVESDWLDMAFHNGSYERIQMLALAAILFRNKSIRTACYEKTYFFQVYLNFQLKVKKTLSFSKTTNGCSGYSITRPQHRNR